MMATPGEAAPLGRAPSFVTNVCRFAAARLAPLSRLWPMLLGLAPARRRAPGCSPARKARARRWRWGRRSCSTPRSGSPRSRSRCRHARSPGFRRWSGRPRHRHCGDRRLRHSGGALPAGAGPRQDELVQACGLSFTVSTVALAGVLAHDGVLDTSVAGASLLALPPALAGMALGQWVRSRVRPSCSACVSGGIAGAGRASRLARAAVRVAERITRGRGYQLQSIFALRISGLTILPCFHT